MFGFTSRLLHRCSFQHAQRTTSRVNLCLSKNEHLCYNYFHSSERSRTTAKNLKGRKTSSQKWLQRQLKDPYVEMARSDNYRCRSAYKLLEIDEKYKLLKPGSVVIDCGAAPGSWTQVAVNSLQGSGTVISIDLQYIEPIEGAFLLDRCDFTTKETKDNILSLLGGRHADLVMSDMAPRASGVKSLDHDNIIDLCLHTVKFSASVLRNEGHILCKLWQGADQHRLENIMKQLFKSVKLIKPNASRSDSAEAFLLGRHFRGIRPPNG